MDQNMHRERKNMDARTLANLHTCCSCEDDAVFLYTRWKISLLLFNYGTKDFYFERKKTLFI